MCYVLLFVMLMSVFEPLQVRAATMTRTIFGANAVYDIPTATLTVTGEFKGTMRAASSTAYGYAPVSYFSGWFKDNNGNNLPIKKIVLSNCTLTTTYAAEGMFSKLNELEEVVFQNVDAKKVKSMKWMFAWCNSLRKVDLSGLNTSENVDDYDYMFDSSVNVKYLDLSGLYIYGSSKITYMFNKCTPDTIVAPFTCEAIIPLNADYTISDGRCVQWLGGAAVRTTLTRVGSGGGGGGDNPGPGPVVNPYATISGTPAIGQTLTVNAYNTDNMGTLSYQWKRDKVAVAGATGKTYNVTGNDVNCLISCEVKGSNGTTIEGVCTARVAKQKAKSAPTGFSVQAPSTVGGSDGVILGTDTFMEWADNSSFTNSKKCTGGAITGLKAGTYYIRYAETNVQYASGATPVTVPGGTKANLTGSVSISGEARMGKTLTANASVNGKNLTYTWKMKKNGSTSVIATSGKTFTITKAQIGATIFVEVTDPNYNGKVTSASTQTVQKALNNNVPSGLNTKAATYQGAADGVITGTTTAMEYSTNSNFSSAKTCSATQTKGLKAGTYYVRYKETDTTLPSNSTQVTVNDGKPIDKNSKDVTKKFFDVNDGDWFVSAVQFVYDKGIMSGVSDISFSPNTAVTRAMFVKVLYNMEGSPDVKFKKTFLDVKEGSWYDKAVIWASQNGITSGYPTKAGESKPRFGPNDTITREQMAKMLYEYCKLKKYKTTYTKNATKAFSDNKNISSYAQEAMNWAVSNEIINGMGGAKVPTLAPGGQATRAQCAQVIKNVFEKVKK